VKLIRMHRQEEHSDIAVPGVDVRSVTALVLAGGLGTRLRPLTGDLPKALAPVAGRPFLAYVLLYLHDQAISDVVVCTGYGGEKVAEYCGSGARWGVRIRCSRETRPLGTAGAIKNAEELIGSDPFFVMNGDSLVRADLARLIELHQMKRARISMVLVEVEDQMRFGSVLLGEGDSILGFNEKGRNGPGFISAGVYLFERSVLETIPTGENVSVEQDVFPRFVNKRFYGMKVPGPFIDIGTPNSYALAQMALGSSQ
jgi:NDP-sugar pyrophosphorylase family protein